MSFSRLITMLWIAGLVVYPASLAFHAQTESATASVTIHVVQRGETLWQIAQRYQITLEALSQANSIANVNSVQVGQRLLIPLHSETTATAPQTHTVRPGETLAQISQFYDISLEQLSSLNNLSNPDQIYSGQRLLIAPPQSANLDIGSTPTPITPAPTVMPDTSWSLAPQLHTVADGETVYRIAQRYGLSVSDIVSANQLSDATRIFVGQRLIIPISEAGQPAVDYPAPIQAILLRPLILIEGETGSIQIRTDSATTLGVRFLERDFPVIAQDNNTNHSVILGVPMFTQAGIYPVVVTMTGFNAFSFNVRVSEGAYGAQSLTISDELAELLSPAVEQYELDLLRRITSGFTAERFYDSPFGLPAAAAMNSPYGTRRSYNGSAFDRYHNGADFASATGTPIFAAAPGRVVLVDRLNIRGNTTVIDHGWGVYTAYAHQSEIAVQLGQMVNTGDIIGLAGATGRITGPHLHWEVWIQGVSVNPMQWTREIFP